MLELYPEIKLVHVTAVIASGGIFLLRGIAVNWGGRWGMITPIRYLSYTIDVVLLSAGLALFAILPTAVFSNGWLTFKLILIVVYIGLGTLALRRGSTANIRRSCFVAALAIYAWVYGVARMHDPLGPAGLLQT